MSRLNGSSHVEQVLICSVGDIYISGTKHNRKLKWKFSMQTHLTHINTIFEYCHASVIIDNVLDVVYLEDENIYIL